MSNTGEGMQDRRRLRRLKEGLLGIGLHTWIPSESEAECVTVSVTVPERHAFALAESLRASGLSVSITPAVPRSEPDTESRAESIAKRNCSPRRCRRKLPPPR